jgi:sirohydrochlorin ferrochelatase
MSATAARKNVKANDGRLVVVVPVDLYDLMDNDLDDNGVESVNLHMDEWILDAGAGYLGDLSYKVVGCEPEKNLVHVQVNAEWSDE